MLAVPVAPPSTAAGLGEIYDEVVTLATPEAFFAVGEFYRDFSQVSDDQVCELLEASS